MAINVELYKVNRDSWQNKVGDLGEHCVVRRLAERGWKIRKNKDGTAGHELSTLYDYDGFFTNKNGITCHRLIEIKTRKAFDYAFGKFKVLQLPKNRCDAYDDYIEERHLPMDFFWTDFRNRVILKQTFKDLLIPCEINGKNFPFFSDNYENVEPSMFFAAEQFDYFDDIDFSEYRQFLDILDKYDVDL